ncbi:MAG TPA: GerMN domain-containing protein [Candidatus Methylomirabilis sp.]|nr:GerMN domain-containing protein [Candidatus Methylomirabilis sp.]HSB81060.1 GerMN domain-containing protein [Candidatus Methylomirabilis sp.]
MSRTARPPALWPWCTLLVASLGVIGAIAWTAWPRVLSFQELTSRRAAGPLPVSPAPGEHRRIRLFFPQESGEVLKEQERELGLRGRLTEDVRAVLNALAAGGGPGVRPPVPQGLEIRQAFLDGVGILYLDFGKGILAVIGAPSSGSALALSAIVTTLTTSFTEIKRVQFLSEGQELAEGIGGLDLRRPVAPRFPGEEGPPIPTRPQEAE